MRKPLRDQRIDQVGDDRVERGGVEVHGQRELALVGLRAVRERGQEQDLRPALPGRLADLLANQVPLEHVHPVRQVQIVRLGGSHGEHGHLVLLIFDDAVGRFRELPGLHDGLRIAGVDDVMLKHNLRGIAFPTFSTRP